MDAMDKSDFIECCLLPLLKRIDDDIHTAVYIVDEETKEEYCLICFKNGFAKRICVTADSLAALSRDVLSIF